MTNDPGPGTEDLSVRRHAFTLVELLVVIAIIGVIVSILLPGLAGARRTARAGVGVANMRSLAGVMFAYTNDYKEMFLIPFRDRRNETGGNGAMWFDAVSPADAAVYWRFQSSDIKWHTDFFAYYWYAFMGLYHGEARFREEQISPADSAIKSMADTRGADRIDPSLLWPNSFLYSPTFWCDASRYSGGWREMTPDLLRANSIGAVSSPAGKVLLWQRMDFAQARGGRATPAWNDPLATTWVATVDGSCSDVRMRDLTRIATSTDPAVAPVTLLSPPETLGVLSPLSPVLSPVDNPVLGDPAFFWATRNGVAGRDLHRN